MGIHFRNFVDYGTRFAGIGVSLLQTNSTTMLSTSLSNAGMNEADGGLRNGP
jgi:hypothetical protein